MIPTHFRNANEEPVLYEGSRLSWRVSAYSVLINNQSVLLIKNKIEKLYDIPGGGIEFGESIEDALKREALEEAGCNIKPIKLIHIAEDYFYHQDKKQFFQTLQLFYTSTAILPLTTPTEKNIEWVGWVKLEEISNYPLPQAVKTAMTKVI